MAIEQWQELLTRLKLTEGDEVEIFNEEDCSDFEFQRKIKLPTAYKSFCQVFGTGMLGDFVRIYCPSTSLINSQNVLLGMIEQIRKYSTLDPTHVQSYIELLRSSFVFGDDIGSVVFLWDLRTYSTSDDNYDIYCVDREMPEVDNPVFVGRDFFEFVQDFCLGEKACEILTQSYQDLIPEEIPLTFHRFKPDSWN